MVTERMCCVCGEALSEDDFFQCHYCHGFFHLASAGPTGKECGSIRAAEGQCGLVFVCAQCAESPQ